MLKANFRNGFLFYSSKLRKEKQVHSTNLYCVPGIKTHMIKFLLYYKSNSIGPTLGEMLQYLKKYDFIAYLKYFLGRLYITKTIRSIRCQEVIWQFSDMVH